MPSIVWVLILIIPLALLARVVIVALTSKKAEEKSRQVGSTSEHADVTNAPHGPF